MTNAHEEGTGQDMQLVAATCIWQEQSANQAAVCHTVRDAVRDTVHTPQHSTVIGCRGLVTLCRPPLVSQYA